MLYYLFLCGLQSKASYVVQRNLTAAHCSKLQGWDHWENAYVIYSGPFDWVVMERKPLWENVICIWLFGIRTMWTYKRRDSPQKGQCKFLKRQEQSIHIRELVSYWLLAVVIDHGPELTWGRKGFMTASSNAPLLREAKAGDWSRGHGWTPLPCLFHMGCPSCFLCPQRPLDQDWHH